MNDVSRSTEPPLAVSYIAMAAGALAVGAIAVGAIAIGRLAIGRLAVQRVRLQTVEIDTLTVRRLRVLEGPIETQATASDTSSETSPDGTREKNGEARPVPRRRRPRKTVPN